MLVKCQYRYVLGIVWGAMALLAACTQPDSPASGKRSAGDARLTLSLSLDTGVSTPQTNSARTVAPQPGVVHTFEAVLKDSSGAQFASGSVAAEKNKTKSNLTLQVTVLKDLTLTVTALDANGKTLASGTRAISTTDLLSTNVLELKLTSTGSNDKAKIELPVKFADKNRNITKFTAELWKTSDNAVTMTMTPSLTDVAGTDYREALIKFDNVSVPATGSLFLVMRFYSGKDTPLAVFVESVIVYAGFVSNKWIDHRKVDPDFQDALIFEDGEFPSLNTDIAISIDGIDLNFNSLKNAYFNKDGQPGSDIKIAIAPKTAGGSFQVHLNDTDITNRFIRDSTSTSRVYSASFAPADNLENSLPLSITSRAEDGKTATIYTVMPADFKLEYANVTAYHGTLKAAAEAAQAGDVPYTITVLKTVTLTEAVTINGNKKITLTTEADETITLTRGAGVTSSLISVTGGAEFTLRPGGGTAKLTIDGNKDTVTASGPLVYVSGGTFNLKEGVTLTNNNNDNSSVYGSGVYLVNSTMDMSGGTISGNTSSTYGGGVYVSGAKMNMSGGTISGNTSSTYGGGVYLTNQTGASYGSEMNMSGGTISGNTASNNNGGGVYLKSSTMGMSGGAISKNTANNGGGVYVNSSSMTMENASISENQVLGTTSSNGGGVYLTSSSEMTMQDGAVVSKNTASNGGGVYVNSSIMTMENGAVVSGNTASNGGGVYVNSSSMTMKAGAEVSGNGASYGGGVYVNLSSMTMQTGAEVSGNTAGTSGGGVYLAGNTNGSIISTMSMEGGTISKNNASNPGTSYGGGVYLTRSSMTMGNGAVVSGNGASNGGGVYLTSGSSMTMGNGAVVSENEASNGGGVYLYSSSTMAMNGGSIFENKVLGTGSGGGVYVNSSSMTMKNDADVSKNEAVSGGGVYLTSGSSMTMEDDSVISENTANTAGKTGNGGGVTLASSATMNMKDNSVVSGNTAKNGGGVYVSSSVMNMKDNSVVSGNEANNNGNGGGVYLLSNATMNMSDGSVSGNTARDSGGGVYVYGATMNMSGGSVSDNNATDSGGGVSLASSATMNMSGGSISKNNTADTGSGGGVCVTGKATMTMEGGAVSGNEAANGGGVYVYSATMDMDGGTISGNTASQYGGGVYVTNGSMNMYGGSISGGSISGGSISGNKANYGGGVYVGNGGSFSIETGIIYGTGSGESSNTVSASGAALYVYNSSSNGAYYGKYYTWTSLDKVIDTTIKVKDGVKS